MYAQLKEINQKPKPFEFYTADSLWATPHTSEQMLSYHLNEDVDLASRNKVFIDKSIDWISTHFSVGEQTKICDFGCGPGLYTSGLARKGAKVTGVDFSKRSLEYARIYAINEKLLINYIHQNYLEYNPEEQYDLITLIMCDFCALSPVQRKALLTKFHRILKKDGQVLLDTYSLKAFAERTEISLYEQKQLQGFWSKNDYYGFLNTFKYEREKVVLDKYTIIEEEGSKVIYNWLQYFSEAMLISELQDSGFRAQAFFDDVAGSGYSKNNSEFAVIAVKN
ncbi:MAG: class I SAM-dependent methyltransferase [Proteobacteria bacterium]|nr:class I SAM-dependent methyltransferase [Pseudomonadota bacterium]MBU1137481.1 class I SAM-dependent methyltransferase [Pseudomonadota bacterium]MBU1234167.1 class I SAM-dependent methyltransferase [Pseudomonadota bacterium]MBU1417452.1 class I SAM-dependent methyltransferase [Pseudomonadota bacterium]MBU1453141.1 class I SAM-dependent methyltransferase [Pseudomonadota bacterium]